MAKKSCDPKHSLAVLQYQHCDYTTSRFDQLRNHSRKDTDDMLRCQLCDHTTANSRSFKYHSRKHTGDMLQCQHCDYTTAHLLP